MSKHCGYELWRARKNTKTPGKTLILQDSVDVNDWNSSVPSQISDSFCVLFDSWIKAQNSECFSSPNTNQFLQNIKRRVSQVSRVQRGSIWTDVAHMLESNKYKEKKIQLHFSPVQCLFSGLFCFFAPCWLFLELCLRLHSNSISLQHTHHRLQKKYYCDIQWKSLSTMLFCVMMNAPAPLLFRLLGGERWWVSRGEPSVMIMGTLKGWAVTKVGF